jgi:CHAT domain
MGGGTEEAEWLTRTLTTRIQAFKRGDSGPIIGEAAHEEAMRLIRATNTFTGTYDIHGEDDGLVVLPKKTATLLAEYYWCRYIALGDAEDYGTASALAQQTGTRLPAPAGSDRGPHGGANADGARGAGLDEMERWLNQAEDLAEEVQAAGGAMARKEAEVRIDQAIALLERVRANTALAAEGIGYLPRCLADLGAVWLLRYRLTRDRDDLDRGIVEARAAEAIRREEDDAGRAGDLTNLSLMLSIRYDLDNMITDLNEAIDWQCTVVELTDRNDPRWSEEEHFLVSLLESRYGDTGDMADINEAITRGESLLSAPARFAGDDRWRLVTAATLAGCYLRLHQYKQRAARKRLWSDLDRSIELGEWVAGQLPDGDPNLPRVLTNLAEALHARSGSAGRQGGIMRLRAIEHAMRAVALEPANPRRAGALINLGVAWWDHARFDGGGTAAMRRGVAALAEAMAIPDAPARTRLYAARGCGECAGQIADWDTSIAAYWQAVRLLPRIGWRGVDRATGERLLAGAEGLPGVAAAHAIMAGRPEEAVELLESGRAVLWSQLLAGDLERLYDIDPELAERLAEVEDELYALDQDDPASRDRRLADRQLRLARQRAELTEQARQVLQQAPPAARFADLRGAARNGPVVVINTSPWRCDALIVGIDKVRLLPLPQLKGCDVQQGVTRFNAAMRAATVARRQARHNPSAEKELSKILAWLWRTTVEPVLRAMGHTRPPAHGAAYPEVYWCPVGRLSFLPLHAAGYHAPGNRDSVLDRVAFSYAPNLRSLIPASEPQDARRLRQLLVVKTFDNDSPERWIPGYPTTVLSGAGATPERVAEALHRHAYVHVSAHGSQDAANPSTGHIKLTRGELRLGDLRPGQYPGGRFAFLSACDTAAGGENLSDEMITLATAFQYAGFRQVIGATWPVADLVAVAVEQEVYTELAQQGALRTERAAAALRTAIAAQRDLAPGQPSRWLPFIHVGR